ncbi:hypothetical protein LTR53_002694 [Teratosphaeriaceae sp. CCFEE 6253]|nr:hypothetical protein LTR53_002694 [Teratosphaeriaceae sp. CCFEE 6253]
MEKLILRSVMYGADKIPDSWFEKVPGGFYKTKEGKAVSKEKAKRDSKESRSRPTTSDGRKSDRSRRHSAGDGPRDPPPPPRNNERADDGHRSERRREGDRPQRESYDGMEEDDGYYSGDDRRRRRNHGSTRRRRSFEDVRRWQDGSGRPPPPRPHQRDERRMDDGIAARQEHDYEAEPRSPYAPAMAAAAVTGAGIGMRSAAQHPYDSSPASPTSEAARPGSNGRDGAASPYVPYAHIYGKPAPQQPQAAPRTTPPQSHAGSSQPHGSDRPGHIVAPPPGHYQQDPYAQGTSGGGHYAQDSGYGSGRSHDRRYDERYDAYDDAGRPYERPPQGQYGGGADRDDQDPSHDDYDSRPSTRDCPPPDNLHRSKSQGGRGGRERYAPAEPYDSPVSTGPPASGMRPVDPRKPLYAQMGGGSGGGGGELGRNAGSRDDDRERRAEGRRASGYYSD